MRKFSLNYVVKLSVKCRQTIWWLRVYFKKLFVESEQRLYSIGKVPVLHVYIGTIAVQNSNYSSAKVALFSEIANVACTILNTPRTSPYTPQKNPYVARNNLYTPCTKSYVAYLPQNTIHVYYTMGQYDTREGEDLFQAKIFCKAFLQMIRTYS